MAIFSLALAKGNGRAHDAWQESSVGRQVFKFKLELTEESEEEKVEVQDLEHNRIIPTPVKLEVWKRDKGNFNHKSVNNRSVTESRW